MKTTLYSYIQAHSNFYHPHSANFQSFVNMQQQRLIHQNMLASTAAEAIIVKLGIPLTENYSALTEIINNWLSAYNSVGISFRKYASHARI